MSSDTPLDGHGPDLVAVELIREIATAILDGAPESLREVHAAEVAERWLRQVEDVADPVRDVLAALSRSTAAYAVAMHRDDVAATEAWLISQHADTTKGAREAGVDHPAMPVALALARLAVEGIATERAGLDSDDLDADREQRHDAHCDRYVREGSVALDAYTLIAAAAILAATVLVHISRRRRDVVRQLDHQAAEVTAGRDAPH
ncbi:hypothetical protein ABZW10_33055 [Kitasatospora sp. NPDC004723]|uniref:hypothetical protein n=1 Tax=Kitasatospora sp. NPDC004723 TaxID=3154288 RepID=UPI0033B4B28D